MNYYSDVVKDLENLVFDFLSFRRLDTDSSYDTEDIAYNIKSPWRHRHPHHRHHHRRHRHYRDRNIYKYNLDTDDWEQNYEDADIHLDRVSSMKSPMDFGYSPHPMAVDENQEHESEHNENTNNKSYDEYLYSRASTYLYEILREVLENYIEEELTTDEYITKETLYQIRDTVLQKALDRFEDLNKLFEADLEDRTNTWSYTSILLSLIEDLIINKLYLNKIYR